MNLRTFIQAATAALLLGVTTTAHSALILRLTEGASSVTIGDGGANDANPLVGAVTFIGSVGAFTVNVVTGLSAPVFDLMDLNFVSLSSSVPATLVIELTETDFLLDGATIEGEIGGMAPVNGIVGVEAFANPSNIEFDRTGASIGQMGPFGAGAFSDSFSSLPLAAGTYSITQVVYLTSGAASQFSADFALHRAVAVPEPASLALLGIGLAGLGFSRRRRAA